MKNSNLFFTTQIEGKLIEVAPDEIKLIDGIRKPFPFALEEVLPVYAYLKAWQLIRPFERLQLLLENAAALGMTPMDYLKVITS